MKWTWLIFTLIFSFMTSQHLGKVKNFSHEEETSVEQEKFEKSSEKNSFDLIPFPLYLIPSTSTIHFQSPKFFSFTKYLSVPLFLTNIDRFVPSDRAPPKLS